MSYFQFASFQSRNRFLTLVHCNISCSKVTRYIISIALHITEQKKVNFDHDSFVDIREVCVRNGTSNLKKLLSTFVEINFEKSTTEWILLYDWIQICRLLPLFHKKCRNPYL